MSKKLLAAFEKYLNSLASDSAEYARAKNALIELSTALEVLDPGDPIQDAARRAADLSESVQNPASSGDPILDAARRAAGLPVE